MHSEKDLIRDLQESQDVFIATSELDGFKKGVIACVLVVIAVLFLPYIALFLTSGYNSVVGDASFLAVGAILILLSYYVYRRFMVAVSNEVKRCMHEDPHRTLDECASRLSNYTALDCINARSGFNKRARTVELAVDVLYALLPACLSLSGGITGIWNIIACLVFLLVGYFVIAIVRDSVRALCFVNDDFLLAMIDLLK